MKLPKCSGYTSSTDLGDEFNCFSNHDQECENCIALYKTLGGLWNPDTGKKVNKIIAFILYGKSCTEEVNIK